MVPKQSVFITGCSPGGIGNALARHYHAAGLRVIASARRLEVLEDLRALGIETIQLDVTDLDGIKNVRDHVSRLTEGKLDILVNNAGRPYTTPSTDVTLEGITSVFTTNVFSVMLMCQEFVPLLIASKGKIVNIGSVAGVMPLPFGSVYNASKAAVHQYGDTLRIELKPFGVQVITIVTGGVKSNIATHSTDIAPESLYYLMNDEFVAKRKGMSQKNPMLTDDYAQYVVRQTLKPRPRPWIWSGSSAFLVWFATSFSPQGWLDGPLMRRFGLDTFARRLAAKHASPNRAVQE